MDSFPIDSFSKNLDVLPKPKGKKVKNILLILLVISITLNAYLIYVVSKTLYRDMIVNDTLIENPENLSQNNSVNKNEKSLVASYANYSIELPEKLNIEGETVVSVRSLDEIRSYYSEFLETGCPGHCGEYVQDGSLDNLEEQFRILHRIAYQKNCELTDELEDELEGLTYFIQGASRYPPGTKELIYSDKLGICGIKFVEQDAFDAHIDNYEYEVAFLKDNMLVHIRFPLFPYGAFEDVDDIWDSLGEINTDEYWENMYNYMQSIDYNDPVITNVINTYDNIIKTFNFN